MLRAFADRMNKGIVNAGQIVANDDCALNRQTRVLRNFDIRTNSCADDQHVASFHAAVAELDRIDLPIADRCGYRFAEMEKDAHVFQSQLKYRTCRSIQLHGHRLRTSFTGIKLDAATQESAYGYQSE